MAGTIKIENRTERHIQYRIEHQIVCVKIGRCLCQKGRRGTVTSSVHVPGGKGKKTGDIPASVLLLPQVLKDAAGMRPRIKIHGTQVEEEVKVETEKPDDETGSDESDTGEDSPPEKETANKEQAKSTKPRTRGGRGGRQGKKK